MPDYQLPAGRVHVQLDIGNVAAGLHTLRQHIPEHYRYLIDEMEQDLLRLQHQLLEEVLIPSLDVAPKGEEMEHVTQ